MRATLAFHGFKLVFMGSFEEIRHQITCLFQAQILLRTFGSKHFHVTLDWYLELFQIPKALYSQQHLAVSFISAGKSFFAILFLLLEEKIKNFLLKMILSVKEGVLKNFANFNTCVGVSF